MAHSVPVLLSRFNSVRSAIVFSDASLYHGAWINRNGDQRTFAIPSHLQYSRFASETYAAQHGIRDNAPLGKDIHLFCDNLEVCHILRNQRTAHPIGQVRIEELLTSLFQFVDDNYINLSVSQILSKNNPADPISHSPPNDSDRIIADKMLSY